MNRAVAKEITVARDYEVHTFMADDGYPSSRVFSPLAITLEDGRQFFLPMGKRVQDDDGFVGYIPRYSAGKVWAQIEHACNVIDLDHWIEVHPFNLEEELEYEAEREAQERYEQTGSIFG